MTEPAMKQVCVFGGSNSIKEGIWTTGLSELLPPNFTFLNGSVGAVSGIMAYCRLAAMDQLKRRDVVLWEYALNDQNYVDKLGHYPELLLRFCEHTIRLCRSRGLRFIPLIFAGRNATERGEMTPYRRDLRQLFDHYSIQYLDVSEELPKILDRKRVPDYVYQDKSHYKEDAFVGRFIAKRALKLIRSGAGWVAAADRCRGEDVTSVQLISRFDSGESEDFSNSRVTVNCFVPTDTGEPVSVRIEQGPFRLVGVLMLSTAQGGAFRVKAGNRCFAISATYGEVRYTKPLLKFFSLTDDLVAGVTYPAGTDIALTWEDGSMPLTTDYSFVAKLTEQQLHGRESAVVGLVLEQLTG